MPIYEFECNKCNDRITKVLKIAELDSFKEDFRTECCGTCVTQIITVPSISVFPSQVLEHLHHDNAPYVGSRQQLRDAINRHNDGAFAAQFGKLAVHDNLSKREL